MEIIGKPGDRNNNEMNVQRQMKYKKCSVIITSNSIPKH